MKLTIYFFFLALLCSCTVVSDSKKSMVYQPTDTVLLGSGISRVVMSAKSIFKIQVPSNPSTGYRWILNIPPKTSDCFIVMKDGVFVIDSTINHPIMRVGAPGLQEWEIQANCSGNYVLQWNNIRPWEKEQLPITTYQIRLEISPN